MLTRVRFKNWRSLRNVDIADLTPLTVFIGANASGKSNIVGALSFLRQLMIQPSRDAVLYAENTRPIRTLGAIDEAIEIDIEYSSVSRRTALRYQLNLQVMGLYSFGPFQINQSFFVRDNGEYTPIKTGENAGLLSDVMFAGILPDERNLLGVAKRLTGTSSENEMEFSSPYRFQTISDFMGRHTQFVSEHATAPDRSLIRRDTDYLNIEEDGSNTLDVLNFMQTNHPGVFAALMNDFKWMLGHVEDAAITFDGRETRLTMKERPLGGAESPTVSGGTLRLLTILTAYYALDMQVPELPGLVVIEEPDAGLNPGLLKRFVEQLREYTQRPDRPRQFILTTHNPAFLDYFQPEEVRVVSRDEQGDTHVERIPESVKEVWLDQYGLGEVWKTRSFGGLPE